LLEAGLQLAQLLSACPRLKVLVTSRVVLRVQGEHSYEVATRGLPPAGYLLSAEVDGYEGIHLFANTGSRRRGKRGKTMTLEQAITEAMNNDS
jgi:predicted ATPase